MYREEVALRPLFAVCEKLFCGILQGYVKMPSIIDRSNPSLKEVRHG